MVDGITSWRIGGRSLTVYGTKMHCFTLGCTSRCCICRIFKLMYVTLMMCFYDVDTNKLIMINSGGVIVLYEKVGKHRDVTIRNFDET